MKKNNKKGFTLVELVIVVAVMAILVAVAIPTVRSITGTATEAVNNTNAKTIESTIKLWIADQETGNADATDNLGDVLDEANLGIKSKNFIYNEEAGTVVYTDANAAYAGETLLAFDEDGDCTATEGSGTRPAAPANPEG